MFDKDVRGPGLRYMSPMRRGILTMSGAAQELINITIL